MSAIGTGKGSDVTRTVTTACATINAPAIIITAPRVAHSSAVGWAYRRAITRLRANVTLDRTHRPGVASPLPSDSHVIAIPA